MPGCCSEKSWDKHGEAKSSLFSGLFVLLWLPLHSCPLCSSHYSASKRIPVTNGAPASGGRWCSEWEGLRPGKASFSQLAPQLTPLLAVCGVTWQLNIEWQGQLCRHHQALWKDQRATGRSRAPSVASQWVCAKSGCQQKGDAKYVHPPPHLPWWALPFLPYRKKFTGMKVLWHLYQPV